MCVHMSGPLAKFCAICNPAPKQIPAPRRSASEFDNTARSTLDMVIDRDALIAHVDRPIELDVLLRMEELPKYSANGDPGCIFYSNPKLGKRQRNIVIRTKDGKDAITTPSRAAFAIAEANKENPLYEGQHAKHVCQGESLDADGNRICCVNPAHLYPY